MELAPFLLVYRKMDSKEIGCQGFIGPLPSAFLDKRRDSYRDVKNWRKDSDQNFRSPNFFYE
jgi:hypothetical protein